MTTKNHPKGMRGWTELCSDFNWQDYHGMWTRPCRRDNTRYYVVKWTNLYDAVGERDCMRDGIHQYEAEVKLVDLALTPEDELDDALRFCGFKWNETRTQIVDEYRGETVAADQRTCELVLVECCIEYGLGEPLETFTGNVRPAHVRAEARRFAESLMRDDDGEHLQRLRSRPVNAIGSTAFEYGTGNLDAAMDRYRMWSSGPRPGVVTMKQSDLRKCPFFILVPEHYRADGSCKCDDPAHRAKMIAEWGYTPADFDKSPAAE